MAATLCAGRVEFFVFQARVLNPPAFCSVFVARSFLPWRPILAAKLFYWPGWVWGFPGLGLEFPCVLQRFCGLAAFARASGEHLLFDCWFCFFGFLFSPHGLGKVSLSGQVRILSASTLKLREQGKFNSPGQVK